MEESEHYASMCALMIAEIEAEAASLPSPLERVRLSARVIEAMTRVPRHAFVPADIRAFAYLNRPLPIGFGKTISQPFIVALMTELLDVQPHHTVLEVGTGFGYQAAVLGELADSVYTVELIPEFAAHAASGLGRLGYGNVEVRMGNGRLGWPEHAPFDRIMVTAAPDLIPPALLQQLKAGGRMLLPAGIPDQQRLMVVERDGERRIHCQEVLPVRFSALDEDTGLHGSG
mgnify:CR=1 FL=1